MTQPSHQAFSRPAASILRRRWFWIAFVAVLAVLAAMAGGSALADRGELVNTARAADAGPQGLAVDSTVTSGGGQGIQVQGSQGQGNSSAQGNRGQGNQGQNNGQGNQGQGNQGQGNQGQGNQGQGNGQGDQADPGTPTPPAPGAPQDGIIVVPSVTPPSEDDTVEAELDLPAVESPERSETPADEEPAGSVEDQPAGDGSNGDEVPAPVVPQPAAVPVVALGMAPGCVADRAVLVQQAQNEDTKGVSVHFLANADFPASGSTSLTTAPDAKGLDRMAVTAASGKAYVGAGAVKVRTWRAAQTIAGVAYPAASETRTLTYDAFTCEKPSVTTSVKAQVVNGRIVLAMYARNTGNTTLQVKFNPTAHFPGSTSFALTPGSAKYLTVATGSAAVPAASVPVNVVSTVQGTRVALNQIAKHDAVAVVVPN